VALYAALLPTAGASRVRAAAQHLGEGAARPAALCAALVLGAFLFVTALDSVHSGVASCGSQPGCGQVFYDSAPSRCSTSALARQIGMRESISERWPTSLQQAGRDSRRRLNGWSAWLSAARPEDPRTSWGR